MTLISIDLRNASPAGSVGHVSFAPSRRVHVAGADDYIVLPEPFSVELVDGQAEVELMPTTGTWAWSIIERVPKGTRRWVSVPDSSSTLEYGTLVDIDPRTLQPTDDAIAAWDAALAGQSVGLAVPPLIDVTEQTIGVGPWPVAVLGGVLWGATDDYKLWSSTDSGETWTQRATVTGATSKIRRLLPVADGEVLVHCLGQVIRSTGWKKPDTATWAQTLVPLHAGTYFAEWSVDAAGSVAIATEYGSYTDHPWACWVSTNGGATWTQRLDLATLYTVPEQAALHFHGCAVDPYRGLVWAVNGDSADVCRLRWSDDAGVTWTEATDPLSLVRITTILPMPDGIILGGDSGGAASPDGTYRMRPDLSKSEVSYLIDMGVSGATQIANGASHSDDGIGWTTFQGWTNSGYPSVLVGSVNGRQSNEVWRDPTPDPNSDNERKALWAFGPDAHGIVHIRLSSEVHNGWHVRGTYSPPGIEVNPTPVLEGERVDRSATAVSPSAVAGPFSTAIGSEATAGTGSGASGGSTAIGAGASAGTGANSGDSTAIGRGATTTGFGATAIGAGATTNAGVAVGNMAVGTGAGATALGNSAAAAGDLGTAVGTSAAAPYFGSTAAGYGAQATSASATAFGQGAAAYWLALALGQGAIADQERSVALGQGTNTTAPDQVEIGPRHIEIGAVTDPGAAPAATARLFIRNVAGKMQLCVRFPSGAIVPIVTEP